MSPSGYWSLFHWACKAGHGEVIELLVAEGWESESVQLCEVTTAVPRSGKTRVSYSWNPLLATTRSWLVYVIGWIVAMSQIVRFIVNRRHLIAQSTGTRAGSIAHPINTDSLDLHGNWLPIDIAIFPGHENILQSLTEFSQAALGMGNTSRYITHKKGELQLDASCNGCMHVSPVSYDA